MSGGPPDVYYFMKFIKTTLSVDTFLIVGNIYAK